MADDVNQNTSSSPGATSAKAWLKRYFAIPTIIGVALVVYMLFFSEMSMSRRVAYQRVIDSLEYCLKQQHDTLEYYRELNRRLNTDPELMEQIVREQYNMKRDNEDVYVFK